MPAAGGRCFPAGVEAERITALQALQLGQMLGAELVAAAQAGGLFGVAGLQAEQGQLQQGGRGGRCLTSQQGTYLGVELGWLFIQLHLATLRRAEHRCHRGEASKQPQIMHLLHRSSGIQQKGRFTRILVLTAICW